jgi:1,4-alpha-glucan branching enzyme
MRQIAARPLPRVSLWRRLFRTRELTIRVSPARLSGLSLATIAIMILAFHRPPMTAPAHPVEAAAEPTLIRFALTAPEARAVSLAGDFNGWRPDVAPAERGADGVWRVTLPIPPGSWSYSFVVDGKFVEDPAAEAWREDGFGGRNAVIRND